MTKLLYDIYSADAVTVFKHANASVVEYGECTVARN